MDFGFALSYLSRKVSKRSFQMFLEKISERILSSGEA